MAEFISAYVVVAAGRRRAKRSQSRTITRMLLQRFTALCWRTGFSPLLDKRY